MVDIMPVVAAENAVPGKRRIAGLAEVGVLRAGIIPEDDVQAGAAGSAACWATEAAWVCSAAALLGQALAVWPVPPQ